MRRLATILGLLAAASAGISPAADDVVDGTREPGAVSGRQPVAPKADAGGRDGEGDRGSEAFVVTLANGDRLTGTIVDLDGRRLRVRPEFDAAAAIELPWAQLDGVSRTVEAKPCEPRGDQVFPVAGGVIHGTLVGVDAAGVIIDAQLLGKLTLPLETVAAFVREGLDRPERIAAARFHEVHDASGSRIVGHLEVTPAGVAVKTDGLAATVAMRHVNAILFPTDRPVAEDPARPPCTIELANGGEIIGVAPRLEQGRLVVELGPGQSVPVPLEHVARMWFNAGAGPAGGRRRVVFWSTFADAEEEAAHMAEAVEEGLPAGWDLDADGDFKTAADLAEALQAVGVLVVPEMESFDTDEAPDAEELGGVLRGFLGRGGTVVIAGMDDETAAYWGETGLFTVESADRVDARAFTFVRGHRLGEGTDGQFAAVNGTNAYQTEDEGLEPVASSDRGAAVLVKRVGRGAIVLLGMDYFQRSEAIDRVLVNAVTRGSGR